MLSSLSAIKPVILLFFGNMIGALVGGFYFLFAAWNFDLAEMGRYTVAISLQWVAVGLVGSGLSTATVRLATEHFKHGRVDAAAGHIHGAQAILLLAGLLALPAVWLLDWLVGGLVYLTLRILLLIMLWAVSRALLDIIRSALLAQQRYHDAARLTLLAAITGGAVLAVVMVSGELTLVRLLVAHVAGLALGVLCGTWFLRDLGRPSLGRLTGSWRGLLRYARWPSASEGTRLLQANLGPLLLVPLAGSSAAGLFGVARYPAYLFEVVAVSLYQYWLPEASREGRDGNLRSYLKSQLLMAGIIGLVMLLVAILCSPFLPLLGENFAAAGPLFLLNAVDFVIFLLTRPIESVYHGLRRPYLELWPRLLRIPLLVMVALLLVPGAGALGMVWAHVLTGIVTFAFAAWLVRRAIRQA